MAPGLQRLHANSQQAVAGLAFHGIVGTALLGQRFTQKVQEQAEGVLVQFPERR